MNEMQVNSGIERARAMMSESYMSRLDKLAKSSKGSMGGGSSDLALFEQQAFGYSPSNSSSRVTTPQEKQQKREFTNQTIRESFAKTPPLSGDSFPDPYNFHPGQNMVTEQRAPQQPYVQQPQYVQPTQYAMPAQSGIDYNMIKYFINEAIKENLAAIKQEILNESGNLRAVRMPGGNKIQFLDSKGSLYEGTLTLKKQAK